MYEGRGGSTVVPGVAEETAGTSQHRRRVHGTGCELIAQLVPVVGQVPDLEQEGDDVEREEDDPGAHETNEKVQLEVGLASVRPGEGHVDQELGHGLVDEERLEGQHQDPVPDGPEAVAVDVAAAPAVGLGRGDPGDGHRAR